MEPFDLEKLNQYYERIPIPSVDERAAWEKFSKHNAVGKLKYTFKIIVGTGIILMATALTVFFNLQKSKNIDSKVKDLVNNNTEETANKHAEESKVESANHTKAAAITTFAVDAKLPKDNLPMSGDGFQQKNAKLLVENISDSRIEIKTKDSFNKLDFRADGIVKNTIAIDSIVAENTDKIEELTTITSNLDSALNCQDSISKIKNSPKQEEKYLFALGLKMATPNRLNLMAQSGFELGVWRPMNKLKVGFGIGVSQHLIDISNYQSNHVQIKMDSNKNYRVANRAEMQELKYTKLSLPLMGAVQLNKQFALLGGLEFGLGWNGKASGIMNEIQDTFFTATNVVPGFQKNYALEYKFGLTTVEFNLNFGIMYCQNKMYLQAFGYAPVLFNLSNSVKDKFTAQGFVNSGNIKPNLGLGVKLGMLF